MKKDRPRITDKSPNELPGVRKRSFILPFAGEEIWFEHLDGIYQYTPLAVQKLRADTAAFRRPSAPGYIAFVLDETVITEELISAITDALTGPGKRFMRVAFVGADGASDRKLKKLLCGHGFAIGSFDGIVRSRDLQSKRDPVPTTARSCPSTGYRPHPPAAGAAGGDPVIRRGRI